MTTHLTPSTPAVPSRSPRRPLRERRHRAAAVGLVLGALTMGIAETIHPRGGEATPAGLLEEFSRAPGTWTAWALLLMATALLQLPGVLAWRARLTSGPGARSVGISSFVLAGGLVALFSFGESNGEGIGLAGPGPVDPAVAEAYTRLDNTSIPLFAMFLIALPGFHFGWALLCLALARARVLTLPVALAGVAGALGPLFLSGVSSLAETISFWVLAAVITCVAVALFRASSAPARD